MTRMSTARQAVSCMTGKDQLCYLLDLEVGLSLCSFHLFLRILKKGEAHWTMIKSPTKSTSIQGTLMVNRVLMAETTGLPDVRVKQIS